MKEYEGRLSSLGSNIVVGSSNKNGFLEGTLKLEGLVLQAYAGSSNVQISRTLVTTSASASSPPARV